MEKSTIDGMFAAAVKARVEKSTALGTKATWSMSDHLDVAAKVLYKLTDEFVGDEEKDMGMVREVVQATYNHSAFAQRLEKAFEKTGHFQREKKVGRTVDDAISALVKSMETPTPAKE